MDAEVEDDEEDEEEESGGDDEGDECERLASLEAAFRPRSLEGAVRQPLANNSI